MMKPLRCSFTAFALFFAAAAHAQTAGFWFAGKGETPAQSAALTALDVMTLTANSDGSADFSLDVLYGDDVADISAVKFQLHMDSGKLQLVNAVNVGSAGFTPSDATLKQTAYAKYVADIGAVPDDGDAATDALIYPAWSEHPPGAGIFSTATLNSPQSMLTLNFRWKAGASGDARLNFTANAADAAGIDTYQLTTLTVQGPPLAALTVLPASVNEADGATEITATCALSRPAPAETTCTLAVESGGTAVLTDDYTVTPAIDGATILILKDAISAARTFTLTPVKTGDGGALRISLSAAAAGSMQFAHDLKPATIQIFQPGLSLTPLGGSTGESGSITQFRVKLLAPPASDVVVVDIASSDASEARVSPPALTFTASDWDTLQTVNVQGVDDIFDDDDKPYTINLAVDNAKTADKNYHDISAARGGGVNTDNDMAVIVLTAAPAFLRESGGAQQVVLTAALAGITRLETDAAIRLDMGRGTASADDYAAFTLPADITIPAGEASAGTTFSITPAADSVNDSRETIVITAAFSQYDIANLFLPIHEFRLDASMLSGNTDESGGAATFTLALPSPPQGNVRVDIRSSDASEASVSPEAVLFTVDSWDTPLAVTVTGVDDALADGDAAYTIELEVEKTMTTDSNYHDLTHSVSGINTDDDATTIDLTAAPAFLAEDAGAQDVVITARLAGGIRLGADTVIALAAGSGTADAVTDYIAFTPPSITIPAGEISAGATFTITTIADSIDDNGETIVLTAASAPHTLADLILPIQEFDLRPGALSGDTGEDGGTADFTLALPTAPAGPSGEVVVNAGISDTSEARLSAETLIFTAGNWDMPQRVVVSGVDDFFDDGNKTYTVDLAVDNAKTTDANYHDRMASLTGKTIDDDAAMITLRAAPSFLSKAGGAQSITITAGLDGDVRLESDAVVALGEGSGTATEGADYEAFTPPAALTISAGMASAGATVSITPLAAAGHGETIVITGRLSPYTIAPLTLPIRAFGLDVAALSGQATEAGGAASLGVKLVSAPSGNVAVSVSSGDAGEATVSPASLTFTAGNWNMRQSVSVTGVDDDFDDGEVPYTINFAVDGANTADMNYHGITESVSLVTTDDDEVMISLSVTPEFLVENGAAQQVVITAALAGDARLEAESKVVLRDGGGSASVDADYAAFTLPVNIIIPAGAAAGAATFAITPTADTEREGSETIVFSATLSPYTIAGITLPIRNLGLIAGALGGATDEGGATATFTLALSVAPSGKVVVDAGSSDAGEAAVSPASLTFTVDNWDMPQRVTVAGVDDDFDDGDQPYTISLAVNNLQTADANYHDIAETVSGGSNTDDDEAMIALTANRAALGETGGAQRVVVTAALAGDVRLESKSVIMLGVGSGTAAEATDYEAFTPPAITIPAGAASASATFSITIADDAEDDDGETIVITAAFLPYTIAGLTLEILRFDLDVDASGEITAQDGIMIARYLLDVRGAALTASQSGEDFTTVAGNIAVGVMTRGLDVNEDDAVDGDDGILVARYLLGLRGRVLESGIDDADAAKVGGNIERFLP